MTVSDINKNELQDLALDMAGNAVPFRAWKTSKGNVAWGVLRPKKDGTRVFSPYGVKVPALATELPGSVTISDPTNPDSQGVEIRLEAGVTEKGQPKVSGGRQVTLPNGEIRVASFSISLTRDGQWNVVAKAILSGGGAGSPVFGLGQL